MSEMNFKRSRQSGFLSLLALLGMAFFATEEATAKLSVVRKAQASESMLKSLPLRGGDPSDASSSSSSGSYDLYCQGYPVLITEIEGKTQVFVKDDNDNDDIQSEKYRIEGDIDWSKSTIYAAGEMGEAYKNINVQMNGGHVGKIILAGKDYEDQVLGDAYLYIEGGTVEYIDIMGRWSSGVYGKVDIILTQMTYNSPKAISNTKCIDRENEDEYGYPIYHTDDVTISYKNCTFKHPQADPDYINPDDPANTADYICPGQTAGTTAYHNYYIAQIQPSEWFVDAGYVTVICKDCDKRWIVPFGAIGGSGSSQDPDCYSYYVELASTLVPPTCVPGRGIYRLNLKFHHSVLTGEYEAAIPAVEGVHNWGADGICHEDHYEIEMDPAGGVIKDRFGNLQYRVLNGELLKDKLEHKLSSSYIRASRRTQYIGNVLPFRKLTYQTWDFEHCDTPNDALTRGFISGDFFQRDVVIGIDADAVLDTDLIQSQADSSKFIALHGHVLDGASHKLELANALTLMNGEVKNTEIVGRTEAALVLDNVTLTSNKVEWPGTRGLQLINGSMLSISNKLTVDKVESDTESVIVAKDGEEYTATEQMTVSNLTYTREFTHTNWQSLFVPFGIKVTSDILTSCDIAAIKEMNFGTETSLVIEKLEAGAITEAGKPYFIRSKSIGTFNFEQAETTLEPASAKVDVPFNSIEEEFTFQGTYTANFKPEVSDASWYALNSEGALQKASATSKIKNPGRWYVVRKTNNPEKASARMRVFVLGEDNEALAIMSVQNDQENLEQDIYTPTGIYVGNDRSTLSTGIYVSGGKVFVVQ